MRKLKPAIQAMACMLFAGVSAPALADGARDWVNVPINMNFAYAYYAYSNSDTSFDTSLPVEGASVDAHMPIFRYARSLNVGGQIGGIQVVVPYAFVDVKLDGTSRGISHSGFGDIQAAFIANFIGAPALTMQEFATWVPRSYLTGSIWVTAPTGSYDSDRAVNIGKNRWAFKPQLSYGVPVGVGGLVSVNGNAQFFTTNGNGWLDRTLSQKSLWSLEGHYSQSLSRAFWLSADAYYAVGGETRVNHVDQGNGQSTLKLGLSGSLNVTPVNAISFQFTNSVAKRDHTLDSTSFSINFSHAW